MKQFFICLISIFFVQVSAQQVIVVDKTNTQPIVGVAVFNLFKTKTNISNFDGEISISRFQSFEKVYFQHLAYHKEVILKSKLIDTIFLTPKSLDLNEVVVSASKFKQNQKEVPQKIISLNAKTIARSAPQTSADMLGQTGRVFIQKSQLGGGSPMIRGFSTNRVLVTVDGVRLNNAIFRGGNVQNVISINPFNIQNTEVILGAGSVIYGSDAIGGVMNFYTTKPELSSTKNPLVKTKSTVRYSSANNEKTAHVGLNVGLKKWGFHSSMSFSDFDDLKMGETNNQTYLTPFYVTQRNGEDMVMPNHMPRIQKFTNFNQFHAAQKVLFKPSERLTFDFGLHYSTTSDYGRYDRLLVLDNENLPKYAEWNYGPQDWLMANLQLTKLSSSSNLYDKVISTIAYQEFGESRKSRKFNTPNRRIRTENVDAFSINIDLEKSISEKANIAYGTEYIFNKISSKGISIHLPSNTVQRVASRYPNGAHWTSLATYTRLKYKPNPKLTLQTGVRYNLVSIRANLTSNSAFFDFPFSNANLETNALTATAGMTWQQNNMFLWKLNASSAFRAPNIDDIGKVFDSQPGMIVVPNDQLEPEHAYGGELGLTINFDNTVLLDFSTFYTYLNNAMIRDDFTLDGQSQILYDGELSTIQAVQNSSEATIYGFEAGLRAQFTKSLELTSQFNISQGAQKNSAGIETPVRHVAPAFGDVHVLYRGGKITLDGYINYNFDMESKDISNELSSHLFAKDEFGEAYAPSWLTFNLRTQYQYSKTISLMGAIENISNVGYRPYASGISAPGTNLIFAITYNN